MIKAVTQDTLYLILPYKVSQLAMLYAEKFAISTKEALIRIYSSKTYHELEKERTKLWHFGPVALLEYITEKN